MMAQKPTHDYKFSGLIGKVGKTTKETMNPRKPQESLQKQDVVGQASHNYFKMNNKFRS